MHGFAENVVRPAAHEWDEREETPWPILQEAAKIELYNFETLASFWGDETGLSMPLVNEELFWGDGGIGMAIFGTTLAVAGIFASGTPEQHTCRFRQTTRSLLAITMCRSCETSSTPNPRASRSEPISL